MVEVMSLMHAELAAVTQPASWLLMENYTIDSGGRIRGRSENRQRPRKMVRC